MAKKLPITPAVSRAAKDLRKGSSDAGVAMRERQELLKNEKTSSRPTPALRHAAKDLKNNRSGDAGLALEEHKKLIDKSKPKPKK